MTATKNVVIIELSLENCYLVGGGELTFGVDKNFVGVGGGGILPGGWEWANFRQVGEGPSPQ